MHYYKRNLGDYYQKAGRLSMLQHGSYTLLIDACYDREKFPTKEEALEWAWASSSAETEAVEFVLNKFFTIENGVYVQTRIKEEIEKYHANAETNQRIAIERETKRKEKSTNRVQGVDEPTPNQEPLTKNHKPIPKRSKPLSEYSDDFLSFWNEYPNKTGKGKAWVLWQKKKPNIETVLKSLSWQKSSQKWLDGFIPNPDTYLSQHRWEDSPVEVSVGTINSPPWYITASGIEEKAKEIGIDTVREVMVEYKIAVYKHFGITSDMVRKATADQPAKK